MDEKLHRYIHFLSLTCPLEKLKWKENGWELRVERYKRNNNRERERERERIKAWKKTELKVEIVCVVYSVYSVYFICDTSSFVVFNLLLQNAKKNPLCLLSSHGAFFAQMKIVHFYIVNRTLSHSHVLFTITNRDVRRQ